MDTKILIIFLMIFAVGAVKVVKIDEHYKNNYELQLCGRRLAGTMILVCERNLIDLEDLIEVDESYLKNTAESVPRYNGLVEECCMNSCLLKEFVEYC